MNNSFTSDEDILVAIRGGNPHSLNKALKYLYQHPKVRGSVRKQIYDLGGSQDDARESLHQAISVFYTHVMEDKYNAALSAVSTYIVKIAVQIYYTRRRSEIRRFRTVDRVSEETSSAIFDPSELAETEHRKNLLETVLSVAGDRCKQLLKLRSADYSMSEIAEIMGYRSQDVVKNAALDCRKKINEFLAGKPALLAALRSL